MPALDPATREALEARLRFYRELGLTDFYRRPVDASQIIASAGVSNDRENVSITQDMGAPGLASETLRSNRFNLNSYRRTHPFHPARLSKLRRLLRLKFSGPTAHPPFSSFAKTSATAPAARSTRGATRLCLPMATQTRV